MSEEVKIYGKEDTVKNHLKNQCEWLACITFFAGLFLLPGLAFAGGALGVVVSLLPVENYLTSPIYFETQLALSNIEDFDFPIFNVQCINANWSASQFPVKNHGYTSHARVCDPPLNTCLRSFCNATFECETTLRDNATCSHDSDCFSSFGQDYRCNLDTCSCEQITCPDLNNSCSTLQWINGTCTQVLNVGATCWDSDMCALDNNDFFFQMQHDVV